MLLLYAHQAAHGRNCTWYFQLSNNFSTTWKQVIRQAKGLQPYCEESQRVSYKKVKWAIRACLDRDETPQYAN